MASPKNSRWAAAAAVGSAALAAGLAPVAFADSPDNGALAPAAPRTNVVLSLDDGELSLDLKHDARAPSSSTPAPDLDVGGDARTTVPEDDDYTFLGRPGTPVWVLEGSTPGGQVPDEAPRWDTTGIPVGQLAESEVEWALTGIEGPGNVAVFQPAKDATAGAEASGPQVLFNSADGLPDAKALPPADSGEVAWAFTKPGEYRLTSTATARLATGKTATTKAEWTVRVASAPRPSPDPTPTPTPSAAGDGAAATRPGTGPASDVKAAGDPIADQKVVIDDGHVDAIAGKMVGGKLRTLFKDSRDPSDIVWREPSSVVLHVNPQAKEKIPADTAYSFLGTAGGYFWLIPQVQKQGVVWAGWNTEALDGGDLKGPIDMKLTKVTGPGSLAIWETAGLGGAQVLFDSEDGLPDTHKVNLGVHAHANWGFSKQGTYKVTFRLSGTLPNGRPASDSRTYTFAVGDVDPNAVTPGGGNDGGSTGGSGSATGGSSSGSGSDGGSRSNPGGSGTGGSSMTGSEGDTGGSMAHTGGGAAVPLAMGAGVLVLGGAAAMLLSRADRRRTVTTAAGGEAVQS
ncbi:choice-of-anchor M domain-containing protein [Streptomyces sp. NPDC051217]|uniref:choice-of-anchor M domain-containing protein n=1 Tax=Streptomyces sp. NPDC051217 TaxID=3365644 RepID=UPI0037AEB325